jgi:multisubunit Na+/H+ antiporter MnhG subunit
MDNTVKRPIGMTILLVLSLINAILQIFSALGMWITTPVMSQMLANGELEESMAPFLSLMQMDEQATQAFWEVLENRLSINPIYYLLTALLYIGSLTGVIKLFKLQRSGFHIYSISQMLLLIVSVIYVYSTQGSAGFFNEFLMTVMFILIYHLYLKRIEYGQAKREQDL